MAGDLDAVAKTKGIKYFLISYVDLFGAVRAKLVPASAIGGMQVSGAGFAGFATYLDMTPADADTFAMPDPDALIQLPWKPEVGWLPSDLVIEGKPVHDAPRGVLKRVLERAAKQGFRPKSGVEAEYFLINGDGSAIADGRDDAKKPCYDQLALMRRYELITEICDSMGKLGWGPYQNDHEDANGQFEMNWEYDDALLTADRHVFFKYMVKALAEKHGLRATFMPKPFRNLTGNGCHAHISLWDKAGRANRFYDPKGTLGLSKTAYHFLGGVLAHAEGLVALTNPTVNSYKRINATVTRSGATWSPNTISYTGNNRTHMVRIPDPGRFEIRIADGAANPYLLQAALIAAGLDGIEKGTDPGDRSDVNAYQPGVRVKGRRLPLNLLDALRALDKNRVLRAGLGNSFVDSYIKLKMEEWHDYTRHLSKWETEHTLDC